jgi:hypothetical protein
VRGIRGDNCQAQKAEVGHRAGNGPDVEGIARGDEKNLQGFALGARLGQELIVVPATAGRAIVSGVARYNYVGRVRMNRRDFREAALHIFLYALPVYLPFYQAILAAGFSRAVFLLLLSVLVMFLVANRADVSRVIAACLRAFSTSWMIPPLHISPSETSRSSLFVPATPSLSPLFQRPPPIYSF